jgi:anti-sigma factor RsiW
MRRPEVRCIEFVEQVTEWLEGGLSDEGRVLFEEHLVYCPACERYIEQFRRTLSLLRDQPAPHAPAPAVRAALLSAFRQRNA